MTQRILIVDDDKDLVEVYRRALVRHGYEVICTYNGKEGLEALRNNQIDLVVLDLRMPKMSGDEFLKFIRNDPTLKETKVLVTSTAVYNYRKDGGIVDRFLMFLYEHDKYENLRDIRSDRSNISKKAEEYGKLAGKFDIEEKAKRNIDRNLYGGPIEESDPKFQRRTGETLVAKVKAMLGQG